MFEEKTKQIGKQQKQVLVLYISTFVGLVLGVLNSMINTNALPPEQFGDVRYVQNIISFISSLLLVGYFVSGSRLLALSKDEFYSRRIRGAMCVILSVTVFIVMACMLALYFVSPHIGKESVASLFLVSIPVCGNVLMLNYVNTTAQGDNHIGRIAAARLFPSALYCVTAYLIFRYYEASPILMLSLFNGIAVVVLLTVIISTKPVFSGLKESFRLLNEENKKYGFNVYVGSLAGVSTAYIAGITLGQFCEDNANVGFYTLALTLASPLTMLPSIIGTTYFKRFATQNKIERKVLFSSVLMTVGSGLLFILFIHFIVRILYNESYYVVGTIAAYLSVGMCFHGLGDMFNRYLGSHGQGKMLRNGAFMCGFVVLIGSTLFVYLWGIKGAVITKILSSFVYFISMVVYYLKFTSQH